MPPDGAIPLFHKSVNGNYWLWDDLLLQAAQDGDFGLRLVSVDLLN